MSAGGPSRRIVFSPDTPHIIRMNSLRSSSTTKTTFDVRSIGTLVDIPDIQRQAYNAAMRETASTGIGTSDTYADR
jgi:hypothetical protein